MNRSFRCLIGLRVYSFDIADEEVGKAIEERGKNAYIAFERRVFGSICSCMSSYRMEAYLSKCEGGENPSPDSGSMSLQDNQWATTASHRVDLYLFGADGVPEEVRAWAAKPIGLIVVQVLVDGTWRTINDKGQMTD